MVAEGVDAVEVGVVEVEGAAEVAINMTMTILEVIR